MNRRDFIKSMIAASAAPAIVKADSLMKLYVPSREIITANDDSVCRTGITLIVVVRTTPSELILSTLSAEDAKCSNLFVGDYIQIGNEHMTIQSIRRNYNWNNQHKEFTRRNESFDLDLYNKYGLKKQ